ncbi:hypothetical protein FM121_13425 [Vagococcus fluvialis bH819]|uniref:Uncharacterized protein n=2 Tax=Enterococcaceae TaxID=81852 RepID=A0A1X6WRV8_9ENTE|nr:hypothetical protein FM121_13425 [Vagococcus fluvialis bH819]
MAMKAISGDIESINLDVYADRFKSNQVVAFIISSYYVVEKFAGNVKTFIINIIDKSLLFFKEKVN